MTMTLEARRRQLLGKLGRSLADVLRNYEALTAEAVACLKTEKGYELVSPPKGSNKKYQARTSGKPCSQRQLGKGFDTAEQAAREVFLWIIGIIDTPPTPSRVKDRNARGQGVRKKDRCSHGQGALSFPSPLNPLSQCYPSFAGGPDLRTSQFRPKKAKRALETTPRPPAAPQQVQGPMLATAWPTAQQLVMAFNVEQLQVLPGPEGPLVHAQRA